MKPEPINKPLNPEKKSSTNWSYSISVVIIFILFLVTIAFFRQPNIIGTNENKEKTEAQYKVSLDSLQKEYNFLQFQYSHLEDIDAFHWELYMHQAKRADSLEYELEKKKCIENIMLTEGYSDTVYICPSGNKTIFFGHVVKDYQVWFYKKGTNFRQGYIVLINDFYNALRMAKKYYPKKNLKQLAIAHCIYGLGIGTTKKIMKTGFKQSVLLYCKYKKKGILKFSQNVYNARKFEFDLFTKYNDN